MSNHTCEHCGAECIDSPRGYVTGCEHYPADAPEIDRLRCALWDAMQWLTPDEACELSTRTGIDPDQPCPVCGKRPLGMKGGN